MKRIAILLFLAVPLILCACGVPEQVKTNLYRTAVYSFPGPRVDQAAVLETNTVKNVETDSYGRTLFTIWIPKQMNIYAIDCGLNDMGFKPSKAQVIMQMSDDEKIYFYEDICFLMETEEGFPKESIEQLKERNDWDQPLQTDKMSSRLNQSLFQGMDDVYSYTRTWIEALFPGRIIPRISAIIEDANRKILLAVNTYDETQDHFATYFVIYDMHTGVNAEHGIMELTSLDFGEQLHQFKIQNGWDFTTCPGDTDGTEN